MQYCRDKVPFILHMRAAIRADVYSRIEKWGHINKIWHGAKRAPFALIPFAIAGVNLVGMTRLVGRVLLATGMPLAMLPPLCPADAQSAG